MTLIASLSCTPSGPVRTERAAAHTLCETARVFGHHHQDEEIAERIDLLMAAWRFGCLDVAGAIRRVVTFEGLVPGQPDGRS